MTYLIANILLTVKNHNDFYSQYRVNQNLYLLDKLYIYLDLCKENFIGVYRVWVLFSKLMYFTFTPYINKPIRIIVMPNVTIQEILSYFLY